MHHFRFIWHEHTPCTFYFHVCHVSHCVCATDVCPWLDNSIYKRASAPVHEPPGQRKDQRRACQCPFPCDVMGLGAAQWRCFACAGEMLCGALRASDQHVCGMKESHLQGWSLGVGSLCPEAHAPACAHTALLSHNMEPSVCIMALTILHR